MTSFITIICPIRYIRGPYVTNLLNRTLIFEWCVARLVVNIDFIACSTLKTIRRVHAIDEREKQSSL